MKKILIIVAIIIAILCTNKDESIVIPNNAIRFRVVANSNKLEDQIIKSNISISVQDYIYNLTKNATSSKETKEILLKNKNNIEEVVKKYMVMNNLNETFDVSIGNNYFPKKSFKGINYDAGYYDSVVVNIGASKGLNWWCVIYPPLCLIDETKEETEYTTLVQELIDKFNM